MKKHDRLQEKMREMRFAKKILKPEFLDFHDNKEELKNRNINSFKSNYTSINQNNISTSLNILKLISMFG